MTDYNKKRCDIWCQQNDRNVEKLIWNWNPEVLQIDVWKVNFLCELFFQEVRKKFSFVFF